MKLSELDYELPAELIAQHPPERRDDSRLLVYERESGEVRHRRFSELPDELAPDELVVVNDTRVLPARIRIERPRGEVLLLEPTGDDGVWEGLARPTRRLRAGSR
jgi:S-adenosylmethionine:tRNA ribosyltransferase-isomerase